MGSLESSPAPNGQAHPNRWPSFDAKMNLSYARFYMYHGRVEEAVGAYGAVLDGVNGYESAAAEILLERASAHIELGSFDEAIADLRIVAESSKSVNGERRKDLKFVFDRLLVQIPPENLQDGLLFDSKCEEKTEEVPEPEVGLSEEKPLPPRRVTVPSVILPQIRPSET